MLRKYTTLITEDNELLTIVFIRLEEKNPLHQQSAEQEASIKSPPFIVHILADLQDDK